MYIDSIHLNYSNFSSSWYSIEITMGFCIIISTPWTSKYRV